MVQREGYYRIFKDLEQRNKEMKKLDNSNINIPNKLLNEYEKEIIDPLINRKIFGFNKVSKYYFKNKNKKVRNLSLIGYRLLNFIVYCHLFFGNCSGYISEEDMKNCLIQDMEILEIIKNDWNLLKELLHSKKIGSIQIFMNMIFKELSKLIRKCKKFTEEEERINFEDEVEKLILDCMDKYPEFSEKYSKENMEQLKLEKDYMKTIINELLPVSAYDEKEYPLLKFFLITEYKTKESLISQMDKKEKYPLLNQLLEDNPKIYKMKHLPVFNEFTNDMVNNYSFRISRDDAKTRILENEEIFKIPSVY